MTERQVSYMIPETASQSTSSCSGNAITVSLGGGMATANGNSNCTSITTAGRSPLAGVHSVPQVHVRAIMPTEEVTLWCKPGFRSCRSLQPGHFNAQRDGNNLWVFAVDFGGKQQKIKYPYEGDWE